VLEVRLGGGLSLARDGVPVSLPRSRRGRALLAWLALHPGMHARGTLAGRFWPDVLEASARTSLRAALTELRGALGADALCLRTTREAVGLDGCWIDVREFDRLRAAGDDAGAVAACDGVLLLGMDEEWVDAVRAEHDARAGEALAALAGAAERAGDLPAAVAWSRRAAALDPLGEPAHVELVRRMAAAGDRAGALRTGEQLAGRLRTALGVAPGPALRALMAGLRAAPVEPPPLPAAVVRAAEGPFVGRDAELARLRRLLQIGGRRLVLVTGEPGIGKTRLALRAAGATPGRAVLLGRCAEEPLGPYAPLAEALRPAVPVDWDGGDRARLVEDVDAALAALGPALLVLDDLQWADRGTLILLGALLHSARAQPLTVLATARGGVAGLGARFDVLGRGVETDRVALAPLADDAVGALAALAGADTHLADAVRRRAGGNPFFAQELLRAGAGGTLPASVREAVAARRAALGAPADALLAQAAVLGERVAVDVLLRAGGIEDEAAFDELARAHLLRSGTGAEVEFPHALVREAVLADLDANPLRRARLHRAAAHALDDGQVEEIAHHLVAAGEPLAAVPFYERAAARAMAMAAYEQAARLNAEAVAALDAARAGDDTQRGGLLAGAGEALLHAGDHAAARARFAQATALARRARDPALLARAAVGACGLGVSIHDVDGERVGLLEEALHATPPDRQATRSALFARLAVELYYSPERGVSDRLSAEAVMAARESGDPHALAAALNARHVALWRPDRLTQRLDVAAEMIATARAAGEPALQLQAHNWRVTDLHEAGDFAGMQAEIARHAALAQELRLPAYRWYTAMWAGARALERGDVVAARRLAAEGDEEGTRAGDPNARLFALMIDFAVRVCTLDFADWDRSWALDRIGRSETGSAYRAGYAWVLAGEGDHAGAAAQLEILARDDFAALRYDANWLSAIGEAMEAARLVGHVPTARAVAKVLAPHAGQQLSAGRAISTWGSTDRVLGYAAELLGRPTEARAHYARAIELDAGLWPWGDRAREALEQLG